MPDTDTIAIEPRALIERVGPLYVLPDVALRVNELLSNDDTSNSQLEQVISYDPALTAQLLKLVNSAYYGFPSSIDTISRAVAMIGREELRNLVLATAVASTFKDIPEDLVDMETFWFHSITSGVLARLLARHCKHKGQERFFIAGLLHSIGKLVLFDQCPKESAEVLSFKDQGDEAVIEAEKRLFGFTYADLGAELLKAWQLPQSIWQLVQFQLEPTRLNAQTQDACLLHVAAKITASFEPCAIRTYNFNDFEPQYSANAWQLLDLNEDLVSSLVCKASEQAADILQIIKPNATLVFINVDPEHQIAESKSKRDNPRAIRRVLD